MSLRQMRDGKRVEKPGNFFVTLLPRIKKPRGFIIMSENNIVNSNAEAQETPEVATATAEATATTKAPVHVQTAHDDFDWSIDKRNVAVYTKEEKEKYDKVYETLSWRSPTANWSRAW
jgi:hypothetical protein